MRASYRGHEPCVRALIAAGASVEAKAEDGWTALMLASRQGHELCVRALIAAGARVEATDKNGETALMLASAGGHEPCVGALIAAGASVEAKKKDGLTPRIGCWLPPILSHKLQTLFASFTLAPVSSLYCSSRLIARSSEAKEFT